MTAKPVVVTGPEHSGTGLVSRIVKTGVPHAIHLAQPHVDYVGREVWWNYQSLLTDHAGDWSGLPKFVIVHRDRVYRNLSSEGRGQSSAAAEYRYQHALRRLAALRNAIWVQLEALVYKPLVQVQRISDFLNVQLSIPEDIYDPNDRFRLAIYREDGGMGQSRQGTQDVEGSIAQV